LRQERERDIAGGDSKARTGVKPMGKRVALDIVNYMKPATTPLCECAGVRASTHTAANAVLAHVAGSSGTAAGASER
jgi:hypothetical protein